MKYELGLFDHPYVDESKVDSTLSRPEGRELERKVAARSMVLLKNDNHTLPLSKSVKKIAVIGPLADSTRDIEGGWTVEGLFGGPSKSHPSPSWPASRTSSARRRNQLRRRAESCARIPVSLRHDLWNQASAAATEAETADRPSPKPRPPLLAPTS